VQGCSQQMGNMRAKWWEQWIPDKEKFTSDGRPLPSGGWMKIPGTKIIVPADSSEVPEFPTGYRLERYTTGRGTTERKAVPLTDGSTQ
jgi:hypothetical protein